MDSGQLTTVSFNNRNALRVRPRERFGRPSLHQFARSLSTAALTLFTPLAASAQILPDNTLPQNSIVTPSGAVQTITGGTTAGSTLYHSFSQFDLPAGQTSTFSNSTAISNIIARITGSQPSYLDGTLETLGNANLFFLNPNGIIFGPNAQLKIGGSFYASTAESVLLSDGSSFSATTPAPPALTVSVPIGLQLGANPGSIVNRSGNLGFPVTSPNRTLALVGGEIRLEGGKLAAPGGTVQLASTANSTFNLNTSPQNLALAKPIQLLGGAAIETSGLAGGAIQLWGGEVSLTQNSRVVSNTFGNTNGRGITINAAQFNIESGSYISSSTFGGSGNAGNIQINSSGVRLRGEVPFRIVGQLLNGTFSPFSVSNGLYSLSGGRGAAGQVTIAADNLAIENGAAVLSSALSSGAGNNIALNVSQLAKIDNGSLLITGTIGSGNAGDFNIQAGRLQILNGSTLTTTPGNPANSTGNAGNITVVANDIEMRGVPAGVPVPAGLFATTLGKGNAGSVNIRSERLVVADGAQISSASSGSGNSADLNVTADYLELSGFSDDANFRSGLFASTALLNVPGQVAMGSAGNINVSSRQMLLKNGGIVTVATGNPSLAGTLRIRASESLEVSGVTSIPTPDLDPAPSRISSSAIGMGRAGNVEIQTGRLVVRDGGEVTVQGIGSGAAGNLEIEAGSIVLDGGKFSAATNEGLGGNIRLKASDYILLRHQSQIATNANNAAGGNITIATGVLVALENSDITANAQQGRGGQVRVMANGIFGTTFRPFLTPESDITATSELGPEFSGLVDLQTFFLNPTAGLEQLPQDAIDPANQVVSGCAAYANSRFVVTGRGGLPDNPLATLRGETLWRDWQDFSSPRAGEGGSSIVPDSHPAPAVVEATSWRVNARGRVELVANRSAEMMTAISNCSRGNQG